VLRLAQIYVAGPVAQGDLDQDKLKAAALADKQSTTFNNSLDQWVKDSGAKTYANRIKTS